MINFERYEESQKLRELDKGNIVIHDNMNTLKEIVEQFPDRIVLSQSQSNVINTINKLISIESVISSVWEKTTTKAIVLFKNMNFTLEQDFYSELENLNELGDLISESNVRDVPLTSELRKKMDHIHNISFWLLFSSAIIGIFWSMFLVYNFNELHALVSYALSLFFVCDIAYNSSLEGLDKLDDLIEFYSRYSKRMAIYGLFSLNIIITIFALTQKFFFLKKLKTIQDNQDLKNYKKVDSYDLEFILDNIQYDTYTSALMDFIENWQNSIDIKSNDLFYEHKQKMKESIKIIKEIKEED